ncbi:unnamed protein product [Spirodela intermedia]|uniref:RRM domain-containing protein n=1 Tax=Spirodela intermedia TaxID=51605 RepID=A0A7I8KNZ6_SPIIN|nr:unnamed protein product [Spirodela intermedia]
MGSGEEGDRKAYKEFMEKVKRTVFIDYLSPMVTVPILKTAIGQFGNVLGVHLIPNWLEQGEVPQCALVEMESETQARCVVSEMSALPFMISGMPRPVRAQLAREEMFCDRPRNPDRRRMKAHWVDPSDAEQFEAGQRMKQLVSKHDMESGGLLQYQLEEEEKLAEQQQEVLKQNYEKHEIIEGIVQDGSLARLAERYKMKISDYQSVV